MLEIVLQLLCRELFCFVAREKGEREKVQQLFFFLACFLRVETLFEIEFSSEQKRNSATLTASTSSYPSPIKQRPTEMQTTLVSMRAGTCARASTSAPAAAARSPFVARRMQTPSIAVAAAARPSLNLLLRKRSFNLAAASLIPGASPSDDQSGSGSGSDNSGSGSENEGEELLAAKEARLAALERGARRGGAARPRSLASAAAQQQAATGSAAGPADWPEGQLLPSGWERMSVAQKAVELYQGRRGFLFWASQAAWYSVIGVGFGWVLFRFVLPGIGLYKLANGLTDAPTPL